MAARAATRQGNQPTAAAAPVPAGKARARGLVLLVAAACSILGYVATTQFRPGSTVAQARAAQALEGDGVKGPEGMMWVPGGEFLMGSDHKLAQANERPAHKVRVRGFWMDKNARY